MTVNKYDNIFMFDERVDFYKFACNSFYKTNGSDSATDVSVIKNNQMYSSFSQDDIECMGFFSGDAIKSVLDQNDLSIENVKQFRINASHLGERNMVHHDGQGKTLLYCLNTEWRPEWGGHLMILNDKLDDPTDIIGYKPGRVSIFDGSLPHCVMTPTVMSPSLRYTLVAQFR